MMLDLSTLGEYLHKNPEIMRSRPLLQGTLRDIFPQDKLKVNLLLIGFDEDIFSFVGTELTEERLAKLVHTIADNYGVGERNAIYVIETWLGLVFKESLPEGFGNQVEDGREFPNRLKRVFGPISISMQEPAGKHLAWAQSLQNIQCSTLQCLSVTDVREVFFRTKEKLMCKCLINRSQDMETWDIVDVRNNVHYSRSPSQLEKSLIIKKLGKGLYQEADFAYIRTSTDMTHSWGVTYDSIIISCGTDAVIPYEEIDDVDSERGLFTDTMTISLRNGRRYVLNEHEMMATPVHDNISDLANFLRAIKDM